MGRTKRVEPLALCETQQIRLARGRIVGTCSFGDGLTLGDAPPPGRPREPILLAAAAAVLRSPQSAACVRGSSVSCEVEV
jgi:hypothetical protein